MYVPATLMTIAVLARRQGDRDRLLPLAGSMAGAAVATLLLKHIVRRPRPRTKPGPVNGKPSFPSGHATRASAAALAIAYVLVRERLVPRAVALPVALPIAAATGVSRAYADAHWTTDVVGGWALGGGHTTGVTAEALTIAYILSREKLALPEILAALLAWSLVVGVTRLCRDRHWLSDVLAGWIAGVGVASLSVIFYQARVGQQSST